MSARVFRYLHRDDVDHISEVLQLPEWGYPRAISELEREASIWLCYGDDVCVWFHAEEDLSPRNVALHICAHEDARGRWLGRAFIDGLRAILGLADADMVWVRSPSPEVAALLRRLPGWVVNADDWYYVLEGPGPSEGGSDHGELE